MKVSVIKGFYLGENTLDFVDHVHDTNNGAISVYRHAKNGHSAEPCLLVHFAIESGILRGISRLDQVATGKYWVPEPGALDQMVPGPRNQFKRAWMGARIKCRETV